MKKSLIYLSFLLAVAFFTACSPTEDRTDIDGIVNTSLSYSVSKTTSPDYHLIVNQKSIAVPHWTVYFGGKLLASSDLVYDTIAVPFKGDYKVVLTSYFHDGFYLKDSTTITVNTNNPGYFTDARWNYLTNGATGKTWTLNMTAPLGFYGTTYPTGTDNWNYLPDLASNSWVMTNRYYGTMSFNLDGGFNYSKTSVDANGNSTTTTGAFLLDLSTGTINLVGAELLVGDYGSAANSLSKNLKVYKIAKDSLIIAPLRIVSPCYLGYLYKPKS